MRIERDLGERHISVGQLGLRVLEPHAADVSMRRDTHRNRKLAGEMKRTVAGGLCEMCERDVIFDVCGNVFKDAAQPRVIEAVVGGLGGHR